MYKVVIDEERCKACGLCIHYCPRKVIGWSQKINKRGFKPAKVERPSQCIGCGFCFLMCPEACIEVYEEQK